MTSQAVCITGVGLVSPAGSDSTEVWKALEGSRPWMATHDGSRFAPFVYHPERPFDAATQIKVKTHIRSMGRSQLNATYAAALALESAGIKEHPDVLANTDIFVACGAGDNDVEADEAILRDAPGQANRDAFLNERLMGMRPSLYLNQLPNLFAANISICHGVTGNSLTFIGDEAAGMNALHTAYRQVRSGQSDVMLVGGVSEGGRRHCLEGLAGRGELLEGEFVEIWDRTHRETCLGNGAAFLVLESESHARRRGADIKGHLSELGLSYASRTSASASTGTRRLLDSMARVPERVPQVITCSNLSRPMLGEEEDFWSGRTANYQNACNVVGGMLEGSLPMGVALAVLGLERRSTLPPLSSRHARAERCASPSGLLVGCWGRSRGEAVAFVEACR
jgi:3-oxoacyl-[acyl-carrier-protein] synthase II